MTINLSWERREVAALAGLLSLSFLVRLLLFPLPGYQIDTTDFTIWLSTAANHGIRSFYSIVWSDYPPFNIYVFWVFGSLGKSLSLFGTNLVNYVIKLPPNLFDVATGFLIYAFVRARLSFRMALLTLAFYVFNPAVIFNAAVWGQYDAIYTFFLVFSLVLFFARKPEFSAVAIALGLLTKPQGIALLPLIAFIIFIQFGWRRFLTSVAAFAATVIVVILPFQWSNPVSFLSNIYFGAYQGYTYTSINAFNIWAFQGFWKPDNIPYFSLGTFKIGYFFLTGWILFGVVTVFMLYLVHKRSKMSNGLVIVFAAFVFLFSFFMLPTRIHERYLFPALSIGALLVPFFKKTRLIYIGVSLTCFVNQAFVMYMLRAAYPSGVDLSGSWVALVVSLINLAIFLYVLMLSWAEFRGRSWLSPIRTEAVGEAPREG